MRIIVSRTSIPGIQSPEFSGQIVAEFRAVRSDKSRPREYTRTYTDTQVDGHIFFSSDITILSKRCGENALYGGTQRVRRRHTEREKESRGHTQAPARRSVETQHFMVNAFYCSRLPRRSSRRRSKADAEQ